jgi:hypothetical protein
MVLHSTVTMTKGSNAGTHRGLSEKDVLTLPSGPIVPGLITNMQIGCVSYGVVCDDGKPSQAHVTLSVDDGEGGVHGVMNAKVLLDGKRQILLLSRDQKTKDKAASRHSRNDSMVNEEKAVRRR